ncbi:MAG: TetR family transcriptional regulator [Acidimicrobiales bacterium]
MTASAKTASAKTASAKTASAKTASAKTASAKTASAKAQLLDAVVDHALDRGIADQSLRSIAEAVGTSHRMLIHHFGSKEGLLVAVIRAVEERQRQTMEALWLKSEADAATVGKRFWEHLCQPRMASQERLFFEAYGQALQGRSWATPLLEGIVENWLEPITRLLIASGAEPSHAPVDARLLLAVTRGLLLDRLATGSDEAVEMAMGRFAALFFSSAPAGSLRG